MRVAIMAAMPLAVMLTACAAPKQDATGAPAAKAAVCEREAQTGSMLGRRQCAPALSEAERARMAAEMQTQVRPTATNPGGGGR